MIQSIFISVKFGRNFLRSELFRRKTCLIIVFKIVTKDDNS